MITFDGYINLHISGKNIEAKPVISFHIALNIAKYCFNVYFDVSGVIDLGGLAFVNNQVLF